MLWQVPEVSSGDAGMGEEEAGDGVLELLVSSHLLGSFEKVSAPVLLW